MKRFHLFEFEDLTWFPGFLRNYMTDYLQHVTNLFDFYAPVVPVLIRGLRAAPEPTMIDLAAGGGGGVLKLVDHLADAVPDLKVVLTDFYPNLAAFKRTVSHRPEVFSYDPDPVDARDVPAELLGLRTQFLSIHHFEPDEVRGILQNAVAAGAPIAFFEVQKRDLAHLIRFSFAPIAVLLLSLFTRPFRAGRLLFTYLIPLVPFLVLWDGLVSVLRTYTPAELRAIVAEVDGGDRYTWEIEEISENHRTLIYLLGCPKESD